MSEEFKNAAIYALPALILGSGGTYLGSDLLGRHGEVSAVQVTSTQQVILSEITEIKTQQNKQWQLKVNKEIFDLTTQYEREVNRLYTQLALCVGTSQ